MSGDADVIVRVADGTEPWGGQGFSNLDLRQHGARSLGDVACDALPDSRANAERIYLWYGPSEHRAVVALRPIELPEIFI